MTELFTTLPPIARLAIIAVAVVVGFLLLADIGIGPILTAAAVLVAGISAGWTASGAALAAGLAVIPAYIGACLLKPRGPCLWCKGASKRGVTDEGYFRNCWLCGGSGQRRRIGAKLLRRHRRHVGLGGDK